MSQPLENIRVLDFTWMAMGPYCTRMLTQMGADVVKVESATRLDINRRPHPLYGRLDIPPFDQLQAGKRSIQLNLKKEPALKLVYDLVREADVVAENFRPGVAARLGIDYDVLSEINPNLIMISLSAYGARGPESQLPGYAAIFAAEGGLGSLTGYEDGPPSELRNPMDHVSGLMGALAVCGAIYRRQRTGLGSYIDLSARDVAVGLIGDALIACQSGRTPARRGNSDPLMAPHGVYKCVGDDAWVAIAVRGDEEFERFSRALGNTNWVTCGAYRTLAQRKANEVSLNDAISEWTAHRDAATVVSILQGAGVPAQAVTDAKSLFEDDHLRAREVFQEIHKIDGTVRRSVRSPWRYDRMGVQDESWSPELGADNHAIFCDQLGLSESEFARLVEDEVIW